MILRLTPVQEIAYFCLTPLVSTKAFAIFMADFMRLGRATTYENGRELMLW
jgi:hypothetical protein